MRSELGLAYAGVRVRQGEFVDARGLVQARRRGGGTRPANLPALAHAYYLMHLAYISNRSPERSALRGLALPIYEELGDLLGQANVLNNLGIDAYYEGRWQEALEHYERSKALRERIGDVVGAATITNNIGEIKSDQGYLTTAAGLAEEAREVFATAGHRLLLTHALSNLGRIAARERTSSTTRDGSCTRRSAIAEEIESGEPGRGGGGAPGRVGGARRASPRRRSRGSRRRSPRSASPAAARSRTPSPTASAATRWSSSGRTDEALAAFEQSLELARAADETYELALTLGAIGDLKTRAAKTERPRPRRRRPAGPAGRGLTPDVPSTIAQRSGLLDRDGRIRTAGLLLPKQVR